jgi:hypothetical protein
MDRGKQYIIHSQDPVEKNSFMQYVPSSFAGGKVKSQSKSNVKAKVKAKSQTKAKVKAKGKK